MGFAIFVGLACVLALIGSAVMQLGPMNLKGRFIKAGTLSGRTKADIVAAVGNPTSFSAGPDGGSVLQWIETSGMGAYHIVLLFDANGVCVGVTHEHDGVK